MQDPVSAVALAVADPFIEEYVMTTPEDMVATPGVQNSATSRRPPVAGLLGTLGGAYAPVALELLKVRGCNGCFVVVRAQRCASGPF